MEDVQGAKGERARKGRVRLVLNVSAVRRGLTAVAVFLFALSTLLLPAAAQNSAFGPAVWLADHKHLKRIDLVMSQIDLVVPLDHEAERLAVDPVDSGVWALAQKKLFKFDSNGQTVFQVDLKTLVDKLDDPKHLVLNPYDASLWIGGEKMLVHVDAQGQWLGAWEISSEIQAMALDADESLWLLTHKNLLHLSRQGEMLYNLDLKSRIKNPRHLAVDSLGGLLWLASKKNLVQLELNRLDQAPRSFPIPSEKSGKEEDDDDEEDDDNDDKNEKIVELAVDPLLGALWVATGRNLLAYDRDGGLLKSVDLGPHDLGKVKTLVFEPVSASVWLGGKKAVGRFDSSSYFVARIAVDKETEALGVVPFSLSPTLKLLEPENGDLTNNPRPTIRLGLGATCNAIPCLLPEVYTRTLALSVDLNGLPIGSLFSRSGTEALYTPADRLPEGINNLNVQAVDLFGHSSNLLAGYFTIDTIPPQFLSVSPANGGTVAQAEVVISGQVDDVAANVTLLDQVGNGLSLGGSRFNFAVVLKPGTNSFTLVARDPAGNEASLGLRLTLSNGLTITNLTPGATIEAESTLVTGTFEGPANTGITVNGVVAHVHGNRFFAYVPLTSGENILTVVATTADGEIGRQTITVVSTGPAAVSVERIAGPSPFIKTIAGTGTPGYSGDGGPAVQARLKYPVAVTIAPDRTIYIADADNSRIRRVDPTGAITTIAGTGTYGYSGDGGPATQARIGFPVDLAIGPDGSLYMADADFHVIRKIDPTGIISTIAGTGEYNGYTGDGGPATQAELALPNGIAVGPDGSLYIADYYDQRVRRVSSDGIITTVAGSGNYGFAGDGSSATAALLAGPADVALGPDGSLYIADADNARIRRVSPENIITTYAGTGRVSYGGDGGPAAAADMRYPINLTLGIDGALYIADIDDHRIRRVGPDGIITTVAGTGTLGSEGDGGLPVQTQLAYPSGIAVDSIGLLYIADSDNHRVRAFPTVNTSGDAAPLATSFQLVNPTGIAIQKIEVDFDGDGIIDFTTTDPGAALSFLYRTPGVYNARFIVTDTTGKVYTVTLSIVVKDTADTDRLLRGIYTDMLERLRTGNIESALNAVSGGMRDKYRAIFTALKANLPSVVNQLGALQTGVIGEEMAEYVLVRSQNGTSRAFLIYFLKGEDGVWRIDGM